MALFGSSAQGRASSSGGKDGTQDTERSESGDTKGRGSASQPHEPPQVTSPKFQPGMPVKPQTGAFRPEPPVQGRPDAARPPSVEEPAPAAEPAATAATLTPPKPGTPSAQGSGESKNLIVGPGIQLNGQISACDRLVVEGTVQADLNDAEAIEVRESGLYKGTASIMEADISGRFEGDLTAKRRLIVRNGGRIEGNVHYAAIVIEEGGQIRGQMDVIATSGD